MSRFFNKTKNVKESAAWEPTLVDLDGVMNVVKEKVGRQIAVAETPPASASASAQPFVGADDLRQIVHQTTAANLQPTRKVRLPRSEETLLLAGREVKSPAAVESFERLRHRVMRHLSADSGRPACVAISSADAAEGKSLVAANLALSCGKVHKTRTLLVDADLRSHGLTDLLNHLPAPGLGDVLSGTASYESAICNTDIAQLDVIGAGNLPAGSAELFSNARWREFIAWSRNAYELVIIDSAPILQVADFDMIAAVSGGVLLVIRAWQTQREAIEKTIAQLDSKRLLGVVFNGAELSKQHGYYNRYYRNSGPPTS